MAKTENQINVDTIPGLKIYNRPALFIKRKIDLCVTNPLNALLQFLTASGVTACVLTVLFSVHPGLILDDTTPTGGDMGAHVWWPAFMRDFIVKSGRVFGWSMDYYAGFPVGQYYFPVPAAMISILDLLLPYNIAFKIVVVSGSVMLPVAAYVLGRALKAYRPIPMLMAFAATVFLFFQGDPRGNGPTTNTLLDIKGAIGNQRIMGGPLVSTMAGEFSFSIALCFAIFFLAAFYTMLRDGKYRVTSAILLALTIMSHLVVAIFVGLAAIVFWGAVYISKKGYTKIFAYAILLWITTISLTIGAIGRYFFDNKTNWQIFLVLLVTLGLISVLVFGFKKYKSDVISIIKDLIPIITGLMLSSIWLLPLLARFSYTSNMRYTKVTDTVGTQVNELIELYIAPEYMYYTVFFPVAIGFVLSATLLRKHIIPLILTAAMMATVFWLWPEGHAWNLRFLPFWYLCIYLVAALGIGELLRVPSALLTYYGYKSKFKRLFSVSKFSQATIIFLVIVCFFVYLVGFGSKQIGTDGTDQRSIKDKRGAGVDWSRYNFKGYENLPDYKEFKALMDTMGKLKPGRALWETTQSGYGTTLALMLLPYYTDHRISSMEGLYFEASGTTAYHFLNVAELSKQASNPMAWPKCEKKKDQSLVDPTCIDQYYGNITDFDRGVSHMRLMGVKYYMTYTADAKELAKNNKGLKLIAQVPDMLDTLSPQVLADAKKNKIDPPERTYSVPNGWEIYEVLDSALVEPLAVDPVVISDKSETTDWVQSGNKWLYDWWNSYTQYPVFLDHGPKEFKTLTADDALKSILSKDQQNKKSKVKVTNIKLKQDSISFDVDQIGKPVLVKVSYYPTFEVSGAKEIYRASPNFMLVIPTSKHVKLEIQRDSIEWFSIFLFFSAIMILVLMKNKSSFKLSNLSGKL